MSPLYAPGVSKGEPSTRGDSLSPIPETDSRTSPGERDRNSKKVGAGYVHSRDECRIPRGLGGLVSEERPSSGRRTPSSYALRKRYVYACPRRRPTGQKGHLPLNKP